MATTKSKTADDTSADTDDTQGQQATMIQHADGEDTEAFFEVPDPEAVAEPEKLAPVEGTWVDVTSGDNAGRRGFYVQTLTYEDAEPKSGDAPKPLEILIRTRDSDNQYLTVNYADCERPADYLGGR